MSSKAPIFRIFNPGAKTTKEDAVEKRRAQLRRAQQDYRGRKTRYVKALEKDLAISRHSECQAVRAMEGLEQSNRILLSLLRQHSIAVPPEYDHPVYSRPIQTPGVSAGAVTTRPRSGSRGPGDVAVSYTPGSPEYPLSPDSATGLAVSRVCDLDQVTLGMTFVLKIEEPCLGHIHGDPAKPDEPSGHACTATSHLFSLPSPASTASPVSPVRACSTLPQSAPGAILERLLSLAPEVACEGEITPIQAWGQIRQQPLFGGLGAAMLLRLAERLRDAVKCHGFGAVVNYQVFQGLMVELLRSSDAF